VVSSSAQAHAAEQRRPGCVTFEAPGGARLTTGDELVVAALVRAGHAWPAALPVAALLGDEPAREAATRLCEALVHAAGRGVAQLHAQPHAASARAGERPLVSALARLQAHAGTTVATLRHGTVRIEHDFDCAVLQLLDGTRDRTALRAELAGVAGAAGDERVEASLERIARSALLLP
jgi:hypothetical protein